MSALMHGKFTVLCPGSFLPGIIIFFIYIFKVYVYIDQTSLYGSSPFDLLQFIFRITPQPGYSGGLSVIYLVTRGSHFEATPVGKIATCYKLNSLLVYIYRLQPSPLATF